MKKKRILFIASSGGHFSELMQLKSMFSKYDSYIITETGKTTKGLKKKYPKHFFYLKFGTKHHMLSYCFIFPYNCLKSLLLYAKIRPEYIITTGAHTSVPMCYIGKLFGSKIIYIETFACIDTKSLSGRLVYPISNLFLVQWENMLKYYPKAKYIGKLY